MARSLGEEGPLASVWEVESPAVCVASALELLPDLGHAGGEAVGLLPGFHLPLEVLAKVSVMFVIVGVLEVILQLVVEGLEVP